MGTCHIEKPPGWEVFLLWNIKMTGRAGLSSGKETVVMLILEFQEHKVNEEGREIFDDYDWWKELVSRAAQGADRFELRCWEDEREGIAFGQKYDEQQESTTQELVYTGALSPEVLDALLDGCVAANGALSYFTLNLYSGEKVLFSSSHYGSEVYWFQDSFAEIGFLMMLAKKHPCIKGFDKR